MFAVNNFLIIIVVICVIHISRKYLVHHKTNNGIGLHTIHILIDMQLLPIWFSTFIMSLSPKKNIIMRIEVSIEKTIPPTHVIDE